MNEELFKNPPQPETERMVFRTVDASHTQMMFRFNSDLRALEYVSREPYTSIDQAKARIAEFDAARKERNGMWWAFHSRESEEPMGYGGFFNLSPENRKSEIGYGFLPEYWGRRYASEAVAEIVRFGIEEFELHRIWALVVPGNTASEKILENLGFNREGVLRDDAFARGRYFDMGVFALINPVSG